MSLFGKSISDAVEALGGSALEAVSGGSGSLFGSPKKLDDAQSIHEMLEQRMLQETLANQNIRMVGGLGTAAGSGTTAIVNHKWFTGNSAVIKPSMVCHKHGDIGSDWDCIQLQGHDLGTTKPICSRCFVEFIDSCFHDLVPKEGE